MCSVLQSPIPSAPNSTACFASLRLFKPDRRFPGLARRFRQSLSQSAGNAPHIAYIAPIGITFVFRSSEYKIGDRQTTAPRDVRTMRSYSTSSRASTRKTGDARHFFRTAYCSAPKKRACERKWCRWTSWKQLESTPLSR